MADCRIIRAGFALLLTVVAVSAAAGDLNSNAEVSTQTASEALITPRNVRIIDLSAENAVTSDQTKWYHRVSTRPIQKNAAKVDTGRVAEKPAKSKTVRRAAPRQDAYATYASAPARERSGFGLFAW